MMAKHKALYRVVDGQEEKRCPTCSKFKPMTEEHFGFRTGRGYYYQCKPCNRAMQKAKYVQRLRDNAAREEDAQSFDATALLQAFGSKP